MYVYKCIDLSYWCFLERLLYWFKYDYLLIQAPPHHHSGVETATTYHPSPITYNPPPIILPPSPNTHHTLNLGYHPSFATYLPTQFCDQANGTEIWEFLRFSTLLQQLRIQDFPERASTYYSVKFSRNCMKMLMVTIWIFLPKHE